MNRLQAATLSPPTLDCNQLFWKKDQPLSKLKMNSLQAANLLPQTLGPSSMPVWKKSTSCVHLSSVDCVITEILMYLTPEELGRASRVCSRWAYHVYLRVDENPFNLYKLHDSLTVIGPEEWKKCMDFTKSEQCSNLSVPNLKLDQRTVIPVLLYFLKTLEVYEKAGFPLEVYEKDGGTLEVYEKPGGTLEVYEKPGGTLLMLPNELTLNALVEMFSSFKEAQKKNNGVEVEKLDINTEVIQALGKIPTKNTAVFITNCILKKSLNLSLSDQQTLLAEKGCEMPNALTAATLSVLTRMLFNKSIFGASYRAVYTRCSDEMTSPVEGNKRALVGRPFNQHGVSTHVDCEEKFLKNHGIGVCAMRVLE